MAAHQTIRTHASEQRLPLVGRFTPIAVVVGLVVLVLCYLLGRGGADAGRRFWFAYLTSFTFLLTLSLGALFFVLLQHVTRSGWSVVLRRPAELLAANLVVVAVLFLPIAGVVASNSGALYRWAQPVPDAHGVAHAQVADAHGEVPAHAGTEGGAAGTHDVEHGADVGGGHGADQVANHGHGAGLDELTLSKRAYLNPAFFIIRWVIYLGIWAGLGVYYWRSSVRQDASGAADLTLRMQTISAPMMVVFALTMTFACFDLLMSLDAHWFSTIFGVYVFSGAVVGSLALLIVVLMALQRRGLLVETVTVEHYHDLGKLLFGFVFFWGYIAFSQYMLIWYSNLPEETGWFIRHGAAAQLPNAWSGVLVLLLFGHFLVPFVGLISRTAKRHRVVLFGFSVWLLVMHWVDGFWLVMPELTTAYLPLGVLEVGCLVGLTAIYLGGLARLASGCNLVPLRDPRIAESLAFENL